MDPNASDNDVNKMTVETARRVSGIMLIGGIFALPWLWLVNALYFRKHLRANGDSQVRRNVLISLIGGVIEFVALFIWYIVFHFEWSRWGEFGESIAVVTSWGPQWIN